jgi:peptidoglycan/LPS O-acetylase OafA/YrhL
MSSAVQFSALETRLLRENHSFHPELDFMRSAAVLMVVFDHSALALHYETTFGFSAGWLGLIGVWIFFVHTTLVLMWSLERKPYTVDFYIRRAFRIYPLAIAAIILATLTHAPLTGSNGIFFQYHRITLGNFFAASGLIYNLLPHHFNFTPIVNVIWTLPLEVDMYILLPALFAFSTHNRARWPLFLAWMLACAVAAPSVGTSGLNFLTSIPCFLPGVMAYVGYKSVRPRIPAWFFPPFLFALVVGLLWRPSIPAGWIFSLSLGFTLPYFHRFAPSFFTSASHQIAKYSYGIYLSHPFALVLGCYLLHGRPLALQLSVEILTIAVASVAGYHLLEAPMIRLGSLLAARLERRATVDPGFTFDRPLA